MSISSDFAVSMMIGTELRLRRRRQTSSPSTLGSIRSSTTRSNGLLLEALERLLAVGGLDDVVAVLAQGIGEQRLNWLLIVHEQDAR